MWVMSVTGGTCLCLRRPLARAAGLTAPEVTMLRLFTGPAHAPLQFWLRAGGAAAVRNPHVYMCSSEPYCALSATQPHLSASAHAGGTLPG